MVNRTSLGILRGIASLRSQSIMPIAIGTTEDQNKGSLEHPLQSTHGKGAESIFVAMTGSRLCEERQRRSNLVVY